MSKSVGWSESVRVGTPKDAPPPPELSEKERMMRGYPYLPFDAQLLSERDRAQRLCLQYNETKPGDQETRRAILKDLLHESSGNMKMLVEPPFQVDYGRNIKVGDNFYCNFDCLILDSAMVEIGDNCLIAPGVHIYTATHPLDSSHRKGFLETPMSPEYYEGAKPVKIGDQCWIGGRAVICPGVTIGDNVVIGAGSVVTKDIPSNVVVGGNPAKIIRYLDGADVPPEVLALPQNRK